MPTFKLFDLMLDRVDLCGAGANPDASIMLFKSKEEPVPQTKKKGAKPAAKTAKGKADSRSKAKQRGDEDEEEEEEEEAVAKADDDEEDDDLADDEDEDAVDEEEEDEEPVTRKKLKKKVVKKPAKKVAKADADDADEDDEDDDMLDDDEDAVDDELPESVLKSLPRAARLVIERTQRIAKQALERATTEKNRRERLEFVAKAKKDIPNLTGTDDEKGELLQALASGTVTKKQADGLVKLLKAADAAQRTLLMSESGTGRARTDDEDSALAEINTRAEELMEKNDKLTKAQARTKVCQDDPALYNRYKVEKRRIVDTN